MPPRGSFKGYPQSFLPAKLGFELLHFATDDAIRTEVEDIAFLQVVDGCTGMSLLTGLGQSLNIGSNKFVEEFAPGGFLEVAD